MKKNFVNSLVELSNVQVVMNREQFLMYKHGGMSLAEIKFIGEVEESLFNRIETDKIFKNNIILGMACLLTALNTNIVFAAAATDPIKTMNDLGNKILTIVQTAGYWLCLIMCGVCVIRAIIGGKDKKAIGEIILGFLIAFAALYMMPWLFDMIKEGFGH